MVNMGYFESFLILAPGLDPTSAVSRINIERLWCLPRQKGWAIGAKSSRANVVNQSLIFLMTCRQKTIVVEDLYKERED